MGRQFINQKRTSRTNNNPNGSRKIGSRQNDSKGKEASGRQKRITKANPYKDIRLTKKIQENNPIGSFQSDIN